MLIVIAIAFYTKRYVNSVADFLAGGRVAGRYVVAVSTGEASWGLISTIAIFELYYKSGFAIGFWQQLGSPIFLILTLTGFASYRFRETRAMTIGQFLEVRYSRRFRLFAGSLQSVSGILNYGLFPAVGARFLVYFLDLPIHIQFLGWQWPTFAVLMFAFLSLAVIITNMGGQTTVMTSDCVMGILSYPMYVAIVLAIIFKFSWSGELAPSLMDRPPGESMLNPFDVQNLRDFNLFFIFVGIFGSIYGTMSWSGTQGYRAAARSAHEQKMGSILGNWRSGLSYLMYILLAVAAYAYFNHANFAEEAAQTEVTLSSMALQDTASDNRPSGVPQGELSADDVVVWETYLLENDPATAQTYETIKNQMRVPVGLREFLPIGILGAFCAVMIFLMISTDSSYLHSWGSIVVQDIIMPLRKKRITPRQHLFLLRLVITLVAVYAFFFSLYFGQVTYILMFMALTGSIYLGGAGSIILGGLYWKRATAAGAWAAMIVGATLAVLGFVIMNFWVGSIYPLIEQSPWFLALTTDAVHGVSGFFEPIIVWRMGPDRFFMNGQEIYFLTMISAVGSYISVSLLTNKEPFNIDRMLHRGSYRRADDPTIKKPPLARKSWSIKTLLRALSGVDEQFTKGDRILSYSVLIYSLGWMFGSFVVIVAWNAISPWPDTYWVNWFLIQNVIVAGIIGAITSVWFTIGGTMDLLRMFRRLKEKQTNELDDGSVIGHMNADDFMRTREENNDHPKEDDTPTAPKP